MAQRSRPMELCAYGSCIHYWSGTLSNTCKHFFKLAGSNPCARQDRFYDKRDSKCHIFRKCIPTAMVSANAPTFRDEDLNLWSKKIVCKPYKTPPYHLQSNGLSERIVQTVKMGLKSCSQQKEKINFPTNAAFKLSHNTKRQKTMEPMKFNGKSYLSSTNDVVFHK